MPEMSVASAMQDDVPRAKKAKRMSSPGLVSRFLCGDRILPLADASETATEIGGNQPGIVNLTEG
jgi:hypothetical protein